MTDPTPQSRKQRLLIAAAYVAVILVIIGLLIATWLPAFLAPVPQR